MRRAGEVVRIAQGLVVVRAPDDEHPAVGAELIDESLEPVGRAIDAFGPVERPYVAVDPAPDRSPATLLGAAVYER